MRKLFAAGRIARINDLRYTPNGKAVLNFVVAADEGYGDYKTTEFMECAVWEKQAEALQPILRKGMPVSVVGVPKSRAYQSKDGKLMGVIELDRCEIDLQGSKQDDAPRQQQPARAASTASAADDWTDDSSDVPF